MLTIKKAVSIEIRPFANKFFRGNSFKDDFALCECKNKENLQREY